MAAGCRAPPAWASWNAGGSRRCDSLSGVADEPFPLKTPNHLRCHLDVSARLLGKRNLRRQRSLPIQPPRAGEKHELNVSEVERGKCLRDPALPAEGGMPEQKTGTLFWLKWH